MNEYRCESEKRAVFKQPDPGLVSALMEGSCGEETVVRAAPSNTQAGFSFQHDPAG